MVVAEDKGTKTIRSENGDQNPSCRSSLAKPVPSPNAPAGHCGHPVLRTTTSDLHDWLTTRPIAVNLKRVSIHHGAAARRARLSTTRSLTTAAEYDMHRSGVLHLSFGRQPLKSKESLWSGPFSPPSFAMTTTLARPLNPEGLEASLARPTRRILPHGTADRD